MIDPKSVGRLTGETILNDDLIRRVNLSRRIYLVGALMLGLLILSDDLPSVLEVINIETFLSLLLDIIPTIVLVVLYFKVETTNFVACYRIGFGFILFDLGFAILSAQLNSLLGFLLIIVITACSSIFLATWELILVAGIGVSCFALAYLFQNVLHLYTGRENQTSLLLEILLIVPPFTAMLIFPVKSQARLLQKYTQQLLEALTESETRRRNSEQVSQEVLGMASQLNSTANQQASSFQQYAAIVSQVSASVNELSATATSIADLTQQVSEVALNVSEESKQIEETTALSVSKSNRGLISVEDTITASARVAQVYQNLISTMKELNLKGAQTRTILDVIRTVAQETHLLSLNAAIEAAGAGEYGERFSVVAEEVRNLAGTTSQASEEIARVIQEIEESTLSLVKAVEEGYSEALRMEQVANNTGGVIREMQKVVETAKTQANGISQAVSEAKKLTKIINVATVQQKSASAQVQEALQDINNAARENAEGIRQVVDTSTRLEQLSENLKSGLAI